MAQNSTSPIFISYSRKDTAIMQRIVRFLREQGLTLWLDHEKLIPGTPIWEQEIENAIQAAGAVLVVMSPDSKKSEWVRREVTLAEQHHKRIFPVLVDGNEDSAITIRLITKQFIDLRRNEKAELASLASNISSFLGGDINNERTKHPYTKNIPRGRNFASTWYGRMLIWATLGFAAGILMTFDSNGYYGINSTIFGTLIGIGAFSGLIKAPGKASTRILFGGFLLVALIFGVFDLNGNTGFNNLIGSGFFLGVPLGAISSRVLFWLKIIT